MRNLICFILFVALTSNLAAQDERSNQLLSASAAFGNRQGSIALDYFYNWRFGSRRKIEIGLGARFTSFFGSTKYYVTAPAALTSGSKGPGVFFKENIEANMDSFLIQSPQVNALNLAINLGYQLTNKIALGFNIDAVGFSFGKKVDGSYINGFVGSRESAKVTAFNVLLISDNDLGSLNSEFYGRYFINDLWAAKLAFQFLFTEYTTNSEVQQFPEPNDRFRLKSSMLSIGITRKLQ